MTTENPRTRVQDLRRLASAFSSDLDEHDREVKQLQREVKQLKAELERLSGLDEQLTKLAVDCGAQNYGGGAKGGNAIKALASRLMELKELEAKVLSNAPSPEQLAHIEKQKRIHSASQAKASTLAIFDSIIFAMSNWSTEGDTAPDFELACQSTLFPTAYERVMAGDEDYLITEVPASAAEVVRKGRELIRHLRNTEKTLLTTPDTWERQHPAVHALWTQELLPLLYGARSEDWDTDTPLTLDQINEWKEGPASRALKFPAIFDGIELVGKHGDGIRETTGLPEFNKESIDTRLTPSQAV